MNQVYAELIEFRGAEQTTNHPSVSVTDKCDLFCCGFKKTLRPGGNGIQATKVQNIVVDRLKILVGLGQTEGHAEHTLQLGFTAQQKPEACFLDDIVSVG